MLPALWRAVEPGPGGSNLPGWAEVCAAGGWGRQRDPPFIVLCAVPQRPGPLCPLPQSWRQPQPQCHFLLLRTAVTPRKTPGLGMEIFVLSVIQVRTQPRIVERWLEKPPGQA